MVSEWRDTSISEIVTVNPDTMSAKSTFEFIHYLDTGSITKNKIEAIQRLTVGNDNIPSRARRIVQQGDIIYSTVRPNHEHYGYIQNPADNMVVSTGFAVLRCIPDKCHDKFLYHYLTLPEITEYLSNVAEDSTSAYPAITPNVIMDMTISLPPLSEQLIIAEVLSSLDDKIEILNQQNATLEALAQTYFRQWFIEEVRDEWKDELLSHYVDITRGASPRPIIKYIKDGVFPWVKIGDATSSHSIFINSTKEKIIQEGISKSVIAKKGDIILSNSATCGLPYIMGIDGCVHDGWLVFRNFRHLTKWYVYFLLQALQREIVQQADGTVQDNLNTGILKNVSIKVPDLDSINRFDELAETIISKIESNNAQILTLRKLRDTLLPKLISGEVRVKQ